MFTSSREIEKNVNKPDLSSKKKKEENGHALKIDEIDGATFSGPDK